MGSSGSSVQAVPVIAIGRPQGAETIIFGMVTSADYYQNLTDHNVRLLKTDMTGLQGTGGVLINLSGKVLGIVHAGEAESSDVLSAYGISDLLTTVGKLSNGQKSPIWALPERMYRTKSIWKNMCRSVHM